MRSLWQRIAELENRSSRVHRAPAATEETRAAKRAFEDAVIALRERAGAEKVDHDPSDPVVAELAKEARAKFRAYIRASRGERHEQAC